jgi:hypothetical protein
MATYKLALFAALVAVLSGNAAGQDFGFGPGCLGQCNGFSAVGGCWCDSLCEGFQDCCSDYFSCCTDANAPTDECQVVIASPPPPAGVCTPADCGGLANGCWCDALCTFFNDCCPNKSDVCVEPPAPPPSPPSPPSPPQSCMDACGGLSDTGCWYVPEDICE